MYRKWAWVSALQWYRTYGAVHRERARLCAVRGYRTNTQQWRWTGGRALHGSWAEALYWQWASVCALHRERTRLCALYRYGTGRGWLSPGRWRECWWRECRRSLNRKCLGR